MGEADGAKAFREWFGDAGRTQFLPVERATAERVWRAAWLEACGWASGHVDTLAEQYAEVVGDPAINAEATKLLGAAIRDINNTAGAILEGGEW